MVEASDVHGLAFIVTSLHSFMMLSSTVHDDSSQHDVDAEHPGTLTLSLGNSVLPYFMKFRNNNKFDF